MYEIHILFSKPQDHRFVSYIWPSMFPSERLVFQMLESDNSDFSMCQEYGSIIGKYYHFNGTSGDQILCTKANFFKEGLAISGLLVMDVETFVRVATTTAHQKSSFGKHLTAQLGWSDNLPTVEITEIKDRITLTMLSSQNTVNKVSDVPSPHKIRDILTPRGEILFKLNDYMREVL
jgi:hypothetical protein